MPNLTCRIPKYFQPCNEINKDILNIAMDVFEELRYNGIPIGIGLSNNTICTNPTVHYGIMLYDPFDPYTTTDLLFKNSIINAPATAYNIILHECLHSLGLDHNTGESGMMNYAVSQNWYGGISDDQKKLWISIDDLRGITKGCY